MVLPATATDHSINLVDSWRMTRGHGLVIAIALFLVAIAIDLLDMAITRILQNEFPVAATVFSELATYPILAVAIGVLSVAFRQLTSDETTS